MTTRLADIGGAGELLALVVAGLAIGVLLVVGLLSAVRPGKD